ncbi:inner membrane protein [Escherichia coli]|uniref:Inner membrane protein n=1 Tax=Escherichia coli TaxID=562 RepID=A0A2X1NB90_ECOLX|nr:hypothetical protein EC2874_20985 [Escherichia coli VL2874]SPX17607.1 inner membrane protein [Escherichia coli]
MADTHHAQGPGKSVLGIGQRIVSIMVEMVETRLRLAVVELEEEKSESLSTFTDAGPDDAFRCIWSYEPDGANYLGG